MAHCCTYRSTTGTAWVKFPVRPGLLRVGPEPQAVPVAAAVAALARGGRLGHSRPAADSVPRPVRAGPSRSRRRGDGGRPDGATGNTVDSSESALKLLGHRDTMLLGSDRRPGRHRGPALRVSRQASPTEPRLGSLRWVFRSARPDWRDTYGTSW